MATTTNYSWTTPDDTALVKDGAAAIRSLGTAIDTTVFNNASAAIAKTIVDAKGDIIAATAADTIARLAVGANDTVLTADSSTATGLKWAAGGGGLQLDQIATGSLTSGTSLSLTSLTSYDTLILQIDGFQWATANEIVRLRINNSSSTNYNFLAYGIDPAAASVLSSLNASSFAITTSNATKDDPAGVCTFITLTNCKKPGFTNLNWTTFFDRSGNLRCTSAQGIFNEASAVSSIQFFTTSSYTFSAGTYTLYGG